VCSVKMMHRLHRKPYAMRLFSVSRSNELSELISTTNTFILDCDGVIWKGSRHIPGTPELIKKLKLGGKRTFFFTNNSTLSRKDLHKKFLRLGFDVSIDEIVSSSSAAASYLKENGYGSPNSKKVYVVGERGICDELENSSIPYLGGPGDSKMVIDIKSSESVTIDESIGAVVVGLDREINYYKLQYAQLCLGKGCMFIATNEDPLAHCTPHQLWAAGGTMVGALRACSGRIPTVVGKPSSFILDHLIATHGLDRRSVCMIGDRLDTDILFGCSNGLKTLLVLSGVTSLDQVDSPLNSIKPNYIAESLLSLDSHL
jgi:phosphoglycolate phosphatase